MSMKGVGFMIQALAGDRGDVVTLKLKLGDKIDRIWIENNERLYIQFKDGDLFYIFDDGQSCCEERFMHTDDDLGYYTNTKFIDIELANGPGKGLDYDYVEESQFLRVKTGKGWFTVVNYNQHNGYYGGFWLKIVKVKKEVQSE